MPNDYISNLSNLISKEKVKFFINLTFNNNLQSI